MISLRISILRLLGVISIIFLFSYIIISKAIYFPDFVNYEYMLRDGIYLERYLYKEPVSAVLMWLTEFNDESAYFYYLISWIISLTVVLYVSINFQTKYWITNSIFLLFNPLHILAFQVPRHYLGVTFFLLALHIGGKSKWVYSIFSIFSQNIIGVFVFGFLILSKMRGLYLLIGFFGFFMCYYIIATDNYYNTHLEDEELRGRGQLIYLLSFLPIYAFITKKNKTSWLLVFGLTSTTIVIYSFSQVAYRFFEICLIVAFFYAMKEVHGKYHKLIIRSYVTASLAITACVVYLGLYGYGI